jgi:hypothetical protein
VQIAQRPPSSSLSLDIKEGRVDTHNVFMIILGPSLRPPKRAALPLPVLNVR